MERGWNIEERPWKQHSTSRRLVKTKPTTFKVVCTAVVGQGDVYPRGCVPSGMCTLGDVYPRGCVPSGMCTLGTLQEVTSQSTSSPEVTS